jgi:[ribosomal protein S18]-alanine N-acetyltransferase
VGGLELRPLREGDAEWCARLMAGSEPWITLRRDEAAARRIVGDPSREVSVAWLADGRVGFVILNLQGAFVAYLQTICVAPEARGRGVGSALLAEVEKRVFREWPNLFLCVSSFNAGARRLYERLGYETVGCLTAYLVPEHDEILMRKTRGPLSTWTPRRS